MIKIDTYMTLLLDRILKSNNHSGLKTQDLLARLDFLEQHLVKTYEAAAQGLIYMLELHDGESRAHAFRVTDLTMALAKEINITEPELTFIRYGSLLHDIGKIGVPERILKKKEPLTTEEWEIIRGHPTLGFEILNLMGFLRPILDIPLYHHERWDGSGYPYGLCGEAIPLSARMFAIVDVWDALHANRPYRPESWSNEKIFSYIQVNSGHHFDPIIVEAFVNVLRKSHRAPR